MEGTKFETDNIVNILKEQEVNVEYFTGEEATEEVFKLNVCNSNILHIATHGYFYPDPNELINKMEQDERNEEATAQSRVFILIVVLTIIGTTIMTFKYFTPWNNYY